MSDNGKYGAWLSTKRPPKQGIVKKTSAGKGPLSRKALPLKMMSSYGKFSSLPSSPPPSQLKTATKQSFLKDYFGSFYRVQADFRTSENPLGPKRNLCFEAHITDVTPTRIDTGAKIETSTKRECFDLGDNSSSSPPKQQYQQSFMSNCDKSPLTRTTSSETIYQSPHKAKENLYFCKHSPVKDEKSKNQIISRQKQFLPSPLKEIQMSTMNTSSSPGSSSAANTERDAFGFKLGAERQGGRELESDAYPESHIKAKQQDHHQSQRWTTFTSYSGKSHKNVDSESPHAYQLSLIHSIVPVEIDSGFSTTVTQNSLDTLGFSLPFSQSNSSNHIVRNESLFRSRSPASPFTLETQYTTQDAGISNIVEDIPSATDSHKICTLSPSSFICEPDTLAFTDDFTETGSMAETVTNSLSQHSTDNQSAGNIEHRLSYLRDKYMEEMGSLELTQDSLQI